MTQNYDRLLGLPTQNPLQVAVTGAGDLVIYSRHNPELKFRLSSIPGATGFFIRTEFPVEIKHLADTLFEMVKKDD